MGPKQPFSRGKKDPALQDPLAIGAEKVRVEALEFCTWNEGAQHIEVTHPFRNRPELFHAYKLPNRRVGSVKHLWAHGAMEQSGGGIEVASFTARPA